MNRIKSAAFLKDSITWTNPKNAFNENGYSYDLNGNIKTLVRTGLNGKNMDNLTYDYGSGSTRSNRLLSVTDSQDIATGFIDGNTTGSDYLYDVNGNMNVDNNKAISAITYNYLNLPMQVTKTTNDYLHYDYDATGRKLAQQVFNTSGSMTKKTDYAGDFYYENDTLKFIQTPEGRVIMTGSAPEYQYHLKDHLGNVRLTFTTKRDIQADTATFETAHSAKDQAAFLRYADARRVNSTLFDHTNAPGSSHYAVRLNGSANEKYGLAKSISVMPGDTINMKVYAKYVDPNSSNRNSVLIALLSQVASLQSGVVIDGAGYLTNGNTPNPYLGLAGEGSSSGSGPKAYLNYIMFDRNYVPILNDVNQTNFVRMTGAGKEDGSNVEFDSLKATVIAKQAGYMYIYLSNEETTPVDVYFDDFQVTQIRSPVIQTDDYYAFGGRFNSYSRENSVPNKNLYNKGSELQDDLGLDVYQTHFRMLDVWTARWWQVDPKPSYDLSVYNTMNNNPILYNDPLGDIIDIEHRRGFLGLGKKETLTYNNGALTNANGSAYGGKVKGFLKQVVNGLNNARAGGASGTQLVSDLQNGARFTISKTGGGNGTDPAGSGVKWNSSSTNSDQPNGNGTTGRPAWVGLVHELGHQWDLQQNGRTNLVGPTSTWYSASSGERVTNSDKIATWWENRVRSENGIGLRENYSFMAPAAGGTLTPDPAGGQIVNPGTRTSTVVDSSGRIYPGSTLPGGVTPYTY